MSQANPEDRGKPGHISMIQTAGRIGSEPKAISTKTGTPMTVCSLAADLGGGQPMWVNLVAFGKLAERLLRTHKGDKVAVMGKLQNSSYMKDGEARTSLQVVADSLM